MRSNICTVFILIIAGISCRKSNYIPPVYPVPPDSLMNWKVVSNLSGVTSFLSDIWFTSASRGFTIGDKLYQTMDGGMSWSEIPINPWTNSFENLFFVSPQYGFAQAPGQLASTMDGGNTWSVQSLPNDSAQTMFFTNPTTGFYGNDNSGGLKKTIDAGKSWSTVFSDPGNPQNYYPWFLTSDTGFVATGSGTFASTSDAGQTWQTRTGILPVNQYFYSYNQLFFLDRNNGFYACPSGILKTANGGQSWKSVLSDSANQIGVSAINVIRFVDANTGYYKGLWAIYKSSDGGQTWNLNCRLGSDYFIGMYFLDAHTGWACTNKGRILRLQQ